MTPKDILTTSVEMYDESLLNKVRLSGKQVLFVDDSPEMLNLISLRLQYKFNLLEGYIVEPNPVFARHVINWFIQKGIIISELIKCAVLDIDLGIYGKDITVNDLIKIFLDNKVPVVLFSSLGEGRWQSYINAEYIEHVRYIDKQDPHAMNLIYTVIKEIEEKV